MRPMISFTVSAVTGSRFTASYEESLHRLVNAWISNRDKKKAFCDGSVQAFNCMSLLASSRAVCPSDSLPRE